MDPLHGPETLEELITRCLSCGLIESCDQDETGTFTITEGAITYWLDPHQAHLYLRRLLHNQAPSGAPGTV